MTPKDGEYADGRRKLKKVLMRYKQMERYSAISD